MTRWSLDLANAAVPNAYCSSVLLILTAAAVAIGAIGLNPATAPIYKALGYRVGELDWIGPMHVRFTPSLNVFRSSWKETWAGDP